MSKNLKNINRIISLGLMSGTSQDGIDVGIIETNGDKIYDIGPSLSFPYSDIFRKKLRKIINNAVNSSLPSNNNQVSVELSQLHIKAIGKLIDSLSLDNKYKNPDIIGFHGHTIIHLPEKSLTQQIGDSKYIANKLNIPVVGDFRLNDVLNGGQGAPLVPIFHKAMIQNEISPIAIINIGGISNITWIDNSNNKLIAFDMGPGNCLLDDWVVKHTDEKYDRDGIFSYSGIVNDKWVSKMMKNNFFLKLYPKSIDRSYFTSRGLSTLNFEDGAATLISLTVKSILAGINQCPRLPKYIYLSGGGRKNKTLIRELKKNCSCEILMIDEIDWDGDMLEANAFAFLAVRTLKGFPLTYPQTTGVRTPMLGGKVFLPD